MNYSQARMLKQHTSRFVLIFMEEKKFLKKTNKYCERRDITGNLDLDPKDYNVQSKLRGPPKLAGLIKY
jgi:hypothetical protein